MAASTSRSCSSTTSRRCSTAPGSSCTRSRDDEMLVALPPGHALAGADVVPLARLAGETWVSSADATCNRLLTHGAGRAGLRAAGRVRLGRLRRRRTARARRASASRWCPRSPPPRSAAWSCCGGSTRRRRRLSVAVAPGRSPAADAMLRCCSRSRAVDPLRPRRRPPAPERLDQPRRAARPRASRGARR